ncbi:unnamed protein product [Brassica oleracea]
MKGSTSVDLNVPCFVSTILISKTRSFEIPPYNALGWSLMPTLTQELLRSVVFLQRYIGNVLSPMHLWEATVNLVMICLEWRQ